MVMEKQLAAMRAHLAYTESILNGEATSALGAYFDVYQRAVESNRKRLSNRSKTAAVSLTAVEQTLGSVIGKRLGQ